MPKSLINTTDKDMRNLSRDSDVMTGPKVKQYPAWVIKAAPWMAGIGIAVGHALTSSNCSIPKQGSCSACGSCVVALGSLTAWAVFKQRTDTQPFYEQVEK